MSVGRVRGQLRTVSWYARRPRLWPQFMRDLRGRSPRPEDGPEAAAEARAWCESTAVDTRTALRRLTGKTPGPPLAQRFPDEFRAAQAAAEAAAIRMGGPGNLDLLYAAAEWADARRVIETGVAYGWSSLALLLWLRQRDDGFLWSTDMPYRREANEPFVGCVVPASLRSRWRIFPQADRDALPKAIKAAAPLDLCHYDSDKSHAGRLWAYPVLWHALRPGGCFLSDDVNDNIAFREFAQSLGQTPLVVRTPTQAGDKFVGVLVKPRPGT